MFNKLMLKQPGAGKSKKSEAGLVSLLVVSILTIVMALVAVSFSKLMDKELRQSLDNELSAQAYYSAMAGLNDARAWLSATNAQYSLAGCSDWQTKPLGTQYFSTNLNSSGTAKYTCVSIDNNPNELIYTIQPGQSVTFNIKKASMAKMYFSWENNPRPSSFVPLGPSLGYLPQESSLATGATGLLETSLYPIPNGYGGGGNTDATLTGLARTYYMYPNAAASGSPGSVDYGTSNGNFVPGNCKTGNTFQVSGSGDAPRYCNTFIYGLQGSASDYYVRLTARYAPIIVTVQAALNNGNVLTQLPNAQAVVDVTGQGTDVLQRIRARIDLSKDYQTPNYGLQSMVAICKGFQVDMSTQGVYGGPTIDPGVSGYNFNNACALPSGGGSVVGSAGDLGPHNGLPGVYNPFPGVTASLSAGSTSLTAGQSTSLTWSSTNANNCTGNGFSTGGGSPASGTASTGSLSAGTYSYSVTCTGFGGTATSSTVTITVNNPPPPPPPNCNNYSASVGMSSASISGQNPCGIGWSQCNAFNSSGGNISQFWTNSGWYPSFISYSPPPGTAYVRCMTQQGRWF